MSTEYSIGRTEEEDNDLYWHALNFRTAENKNSERMWQELVSCVNRLIEAEREACAKLCDVQSLEPECPEQSEYCAAAIRKK